MTNLKDLINYDDLFEELKTILLDFEINRCTFQQDIYLYIDEETKKGELSVFENPGGNSWLNDDHITIYSGKPHYNSIFDIYDADERWLCEVLEKTPEEIKKEILEESPFFEETNNIDFFNIVDYVKENDNYMELVEADFKEYIINNSDFDEIAEHIFDRAQAIIDLEDEDY